MPEWPIGAVSKTAVPARVPGVRIPLSPPIILPPPTGLAPQAFTGAYPDRMHIALSQAPTATEGGSRYPSRRLLPKAARAIQGGDF